MKSQRELDKLKKAVARQSVVNNSLLDSTRTLLAAQSLLSTTGNVSTVLGANRNLAKLVAREAFPDQSVARVLGGASSIGQVLARTPSVNSLAAAYFRLDSSRALAASLVAQERVGKLSAMQVGGLIGADSTFRRSAGAHLGMLTRSYDSLLAAACSPQELGASALAGTYAPRDYFRHVSAIDVLTMPVEEQAEPVLDSPDEGASSVDELLSAFDRELYRMLIGAREALLSKNADRPRHVLVSLRELVTHALHRLAPDQDVAAWSSDSTHFHEGRPTRRGRYLYICRAVGSESLASFLDTDTRSAVALMDLLNGGTHVATSSLNTAQLKAIVVRVESLMVFLLTVNGLN